MKKKIKECTFEERDKICNAHIWSNCQNCPLEISPLDDIANCKDGKIEQYGEEEIEVEE